KVNPPIRQADTVAFQLTESACVILGSFNIYAIRPEWLNAVGLLPAASELKFETKLDQPGFRLTSPKLSATWIVQPNRLTLTSDLDRGVDGCAKTAEVILETLPWTPFHAIGWNFTF